MSEYHRRAERIVQEAKQLPPYKGDCINCKWRRVPGYVIAECANPVVILASETMRGTYEQKRVLRCDTQRDVRPTLLARPIVCGPQGELFEEREDFFYRLRKFIQWIKEGRP